MSRLNEDDIVPIAAALVKAIYKLPAERRLYPDLDAVMTAERIIKSFNETEGEDQ